MTSNGNYDTHKRRTVLGHGFRRDLSALRSFGAETVCQSRDARPPRGRACPHRSSETMSAFTITSTSASSAVSSVRAARRRALGARGIGTGEKGGVAAKGRRAAVFCCAASLVKDDGRPVIIIDNYDSFTYNLSQVRARARKEEIVPPSSSRAPATLPHPPEPYGDPSDLLSTSDLARLDRR